MAPDRLNGMRPSTWTRRQWLSVAVTALPALEAGATTQAMQAAIAEFTNGQPWRPAGPGEVVLDIATLVENGNAVPVSVTVASPMTPAEHVRAIALFTERNPLPEVAVFTLNAQLPRAEVATRMRLATSQVVLALARMSDGRCIGRQVEVVVTLAACLEG